jgi:hypothetical protein
MTPFDEDLNLGPLIANHETIATAQRAIIAAPRDLKVLQDSVELILDKDAWRDHFDPLRRQRFQATDVLAFITAEPEKGGLGVTLEMLERLLDANSRAMELLVNTIKKNRGGQLGNQNAATPDDEAEEPIQAEDKTNHTNSMIRLPAPTGSQIPPAIQGTTVGYAIRKLSASRPDLLKRVQAGELSYNAAMIEAGFRKVPTILDILRKAWAKASQEERAVFLHEIGKEPS